ncbi:unnamed protein product [Phytophthora fragariaefolia]|uniref:Unnamed protein product n=1 Tax=Phytophthora fragariaefolia TaxID=1490495 RepID=A0A9W6XNB1_9STRA|nr:unnamed protein product [Phytophthora fragariaefolia]
MDRYPSAAQFLVFLSQLGLGLSKHRFIIVGILTRRMAVQDLHAQEMILFRVDSKIRRTCRGTGCTRPQVQLKPRALRADLTSKKEQSPKIERAQRQQPAYCTHQRSSYQPVFLVVREVASRTAGGPGRGYTPIGFGLGKPTNKAEHAGPTLPCPKRICPC